MLPEDDRAQPINAPPPVSARGRRRAVSLSLPDATSESRAIDLPPINRTTLKELSFGSIETNVQVLHNLVLEPKLKIKANLERRSQPTYVDADAAYWKNLEQDIELISNDGGKMVHVPQRLVVLFEEIRGILWELYPNSEIVSQVVHEYMDMEMMRRQLRMGGFSILDFAQVLAVAFKANCAPRRDGMVEAMVKEAAQGDHIRFLKSCLELLEMMKLDLVNHRLHKIRPMLLECYQEIEYNYFKKRFTDYPKAQLWLSKLFADLRLPLKEQHIEPVLAAGLIHLVSGRCDFNQLPETWLLDDQRLVQLHAEFQDLGILATTFVGIKWMIKPTASDRIDPIKKDLARSLETSKASVQGLVDTIGEHIPSLRTTEAVAILDRFLRPADPVYMCIEKRVRGVLLAFILNARTDQIDYSKQQLLVIRDELINLGRRLKCLLQVHLKVHGGTYAALLTPLSS